MPPCHGGGRGFESHPGRQHATVAQSVEQRTENPRVGGSIPPCGTRLSLTVSRFCETVFLFSKRHAVDVCSEDYGSRISGNYVEVVGKV